MVEAEGVDFGETDWAELVLLHQELVAVEDGLGIGERNGGNGVVGLRKYLFVSLEYDVEDDVVVIVFAIVIVAVPIGSSDVKLHIASPKATVNFDFGIEGVGTGIGVRDAGRDDAHALAEESLLVFEIEAVEPDVVEEFFGHRI